MIKSLTEKPLSDSFVLVVWEACPAIVNCKVGGFVRKMPCFTDNMVIREAVVRETGRIMDKVSGGVVTLAKETGTLLRSSVPRRRVSGCFLCVVSSGVLCCVVLCHDAEF